MDQEKLQKMQFLEQNLQALYMQKQHLQMDLSETKTALLELDKTKESVYKIIGQMMLKTDKEKMVSDLKEKEKMTEARIDSFSKQEEKLSEELKKLRDELIASQKK